MMGKFTHYLITRFNVNADGLGPELFPASARSAGWETSRLQLFSRYCASSVNGQSNRNFTWLICCDINSDPELLESIRRSIGSHITYEILLVKHYSDMMHQLQQRCGSDVPDFVITTRLDNDDGISTDFIATLQATFIPEHNVILNLLGGVHYDIDKGIFTYLRFSAKNSFISLIEKTSAGLQTVLAFKHLTPGTDKRIVNVPVQFAFWMTLHGQNAAQRINLGWPIRPSVALPHFAIDPTFVQLSMYNTTLYFAHWMPRAVARKLHYILFKKNKHHINPGSASIKQHAL